MLKDKSDPDLAAGSSPVLPASSIMAALIADQSESRALRVFVASAVVGGGTLAAAFDDLATLSPDAIGALLRGRSC